MKKHVCMVYTIIMLASLPSPVFAAQEPSVKELLQQIDTVNKHINDIKSENDQIMQEREYRKWNPGRKHNDKYRHMDVFQLVGTFYKNENQIKAHKLEIKSIKNRSIAVQAILTTKQIAPSTLISALAVLATYAYYRYRKHKACELQGPGSGQIVNDQNTTAEVRSY